MSRANALSTYLMQVISLSVKKADWPPLLNNLKVKDIQMAFIKLITIVGGAATTAFLPMPSTKAKLVKDFLCLI